MQEPNRTPLIRNLLSRWHTLPPEACFFSLTMDQNGPAVKMVSVFICVLWIDDMKNCIH